MQGVLTSAPESIAEPFARQIAGDWQGAATLWAQIGCPYEQALALADGDAEAMQKALALFAAVGCSARRRLGAATVTAAGSGRDFDVVLALRPEPNQAGLTTTATGGTTD